MGKERVLALCRMQCGRKEVCVSQVRGKLDGPVRRGEISRAEAESILSSLVADKFIDEERFAAAYVRDKFRLSGWGRRKIAYNLAQLGIPADRIERALQENYNSGADGSGGGGVLDRLVRRKWKSLKKEEPDAVKRGKVMRFAMGRGFDYPDILEALNNIGKTE